MTSYYSPIQMRKKNNNFPISSNKISPFHIIFGPRRHPATRQHHHLAIGEEDAEMGSTGQTVADQPRVENLENPCVFCVFCVFFVKI